MVRELEFPIRIVLTTFAKLRFFASVTPANTIINVGEFENGKKKGEVIGGTKTKEC